MLKIYERCQHKRIVEDSNGVLKMVQCLQPRGHGYGGKYCTTHARMRARAEQRLQSDKSGADAAPKISPSN